MENERKSKLVLNTTDKLWQEFKIAYRKRFPEGRNLTDALEIAMREFIKKAK